MNFTRSSILIFTLSLHLYQAEAQNVLPKDVQAGQEKSTLVSSPELNAGIANSTSYLIDPELMVNTISILQKKQLPANILEYLANHHKTEEDFFAQMIWDDEAFVFLIGVHDTKGVHLLTFDDGGLLLSRECQLN